MNIFCKTENTDIWVGWWVGGVQISFVLYITMTNLLEPNILPDNLSTCLGGWGGVKHSVFSKTTDPHTRAKDFKGNLCIWRCVFRGRDLRLNNKTERSFASP